MLLFIADDLTKDENMEKIMRIQELSPIKFGPIITFEEMNHNRIQVKYTSE